jgi:hypothetical protein
VTAAEASRLETVVSTGSRCGAPKKFVGGLGKVLSRFSPVLQVASRARYGSNLQHEQPADHDGTPRCPARVAARKWTSRVLWRRPAWYVIGMGMVCLAPVHPEPGPRSDRAGVGGAACLALWRVRRIPASAFFNDSRALTTVSHHEQLVDRRGPTTLARGDHSKASSVGGGARGLPNTGPLGQTARHNSKTNRLPFAAAGRPIAFATLSVQGRPAPKFIADSRLEPAHPLGLDEPPTCGHCWPPCGRTAQPERRPIPRGSRVPGSR